MMYSVEYIDDSGNPDTPDPTNYVSRAGRARVSYSNGDEYEGDFNADLQKNGQGRYTFAPSRPEEGGDDAGDVAPSCVYTGEYLSGQRCGLGTMVYSDGGEYRGQWVGGVRFGEGAMTYANGDIYCGNWRKDVPNGEGTYLYAGSDARLVGEWENGEISCGKFVHSDGTEFEGFFVQNLPSGVGAYRLAASGLVHTGEYIERRIKVAQGEDRSETKWLGDSVLDADGYRSRKLLSEETLAAKKKCEAARAKFNEIDVNHNGVLSRDEIPQLADWVSESFNRKIDTEELTSKLLSRADDNDDGVVDIEEFTAWFNHIIEQIERFKELKARRSAGNSKSGRKYKK